MTVHPFHTIYAADLDRIESSGSHDQSLDALSTAFPDIYFWVDAGVRDGGAARSWLARHKRSHLVLGSESLDGHAVIEELATEDRIVLSLDYRGDSFLGPKGLCDTPHLWPTRVIAMTLARVGGHAGPDMNRLADIKRGAPDVILYAAGGLRGASDFMRLKHAGIRGVLIASAPHDGRLTGADLAAAAAKAPETQTKRGQGPFMLSVLAAAQFGAKGCFAILRWATT